MKGSKCVLALVIKILAAVGAINWGFVGVGMLAGGRNLNLVNLALGFSSIVEAIVYLLVGIAGVMLLVGCRCKKCKCMGGTCDTEAGADAAPMADMSMDSSADAGSDSMESMSLGDAASDAPAEMPAEEEKTEEMPAEEEKKEEM